MSWRRRSSSALGRLETSQDSSILKPTANLGEPALLRAQTTPARPPPSGEPSLQSVEPPNWLLRECFTRERMRSHSVSTQEPGHKRTPLRPADLAQSLRAEKVEQQVTLEELRRLSALFQDHEKKGSQMLDLETFKCIVKQCMRSHNKSIGQIEQLFMKIDYEAVGRIQWRKSTSRKSQWVTDIVSMPQYNKVIVGTGSRELQLYELSNLEPYCQIRGLETLPLKLDYCFMEPDKCLILYGDDQGYVNILVLSSVGELLSTTIPSIPPKLDSFIYSRNGSPYNKANDNKIMLSAA
ncbi:uncharacterized protein LOC127673310 [Apodemus sylvaticus]|uniref:uncharacterized protein LOC127673310 n=1 Tax=Apodemus sylvaticus TaxID=10129 RepID=UPI00224493FD|nr:uncharacterized protein LOC127673310 [Apodemus sylvaticus]